MTRIVTASWFTKLPEGFVQVGISRGVPRGAASGYRMYRRLAPGKWFKSVSTTQYKQLYDEQLAQLDPTRVVNDLETLCNGNIPALLCFERPNSDPNDWCHRGLVSAWLKDTLGLEIPEFGMEDYGTGWSHPKLPAQFRAWMGPDMTQDLKPHLKKCFKYKGKPYQVIRIHETDKDQAVILGPNGEMTVSVDRILSILR